MKYVLDTNILSELSKPQPNLAVLERLQTHRAVCATTSVVAFELLYGVALLPDGQRKDLLQAQYSKMFATRGGLPTLPYDLKAATWQAAADALLRRAGQTRPWRDAQIAAIAASHDVILVTRNTADFAPYTALRLENWFL
jgi:tRNA(fMet)-specific endonuclease VapC